MNAKQANRISIRNYLSSIGIKPVSSNKSSSLYLAPYRADTNPSLKVSHDLNLRVDYGNDNKGGTLIDLVLLIYPSYDVSDAIRSIEKCNPSFFSFHQQESSVPNSTKQETGKVKHESRNTRCEIQNMKGEKAIRKTIVNGIYKQDHLTQEPGTIAIYQLKELGNNPALTSYLNSRGIQISTARPFCREVYYSMKSKRFFGIGNKNNRGWSIRNKYWKGCTAQGYSFFKNGYESLCVFEGIFDMLSFIELNKNQQLKADFLVLNSLTNLKRAIPIIGTYPQVNLFLDHDQAGRKATKMLLDVLPYSRDTSSFYSACKDLNDYYLLKNKEQLLSNNYPLVKDKCYPPRFEASHVLVRPKRLLR